MRKVRDKTHYIYRLRFPAGFGPSAEAGLGWLTAAAQEKTQYCSWYGRICLIYCQSVSDQARVGSWGTPLSHLPPARASSTSYTVFITRGTVGTSLLVDPNHRGRAAGQLRQRPLEEYNSRFVRSLTHIIYRLCTTEGWSVECPSNRRI